MIAEACGHIGDVAGGLAEIEAAIEELERLGQFGWQAFALIVRSALQGLAGNENGAETSLEDALRVSRTQSAKSWELRASIELTRLWFRQGRRREARELLAPLLGWFTEGFGTPDLKDAKALLDQLGSQAK